MNNEMLDKVFDAIDDGKMRLAIRHAEELQAIRDAEKQRMAEIAAAWKPIVEKIKGAIPKWAHEYITYPLTMPKADAYRYHPATISFLHVARVYAYMSESGVRFWPTQYKVLDTEEEFIVQDTAGHPLDQWARKSLEKEFTVALAQAAEDNNRLPALKNEARRRNADCRTVKCARD
jgi:hypothetical protein